VVWRARGERGSCEGDDCDLVVHWSSLPMRVRRVVLLSWEDSLGGGVADASGRRYERLLILLSFRAARRRGASLSAA
jgi:hypothetical protein